MTAIEAKFDALMNKLGNNERRMHTTLEVGTEDEGEKRNSIDKGPTHEGPIKLWKHSTSMPIGATLLSQTSTYPLTTNQHSRTMRISHMDKKHNKFKHLDKIYSNIMPHLGSNNNKQDREQKIKGRGDIIPLRTRCLLSWGEIRGC